MKIYLVKRSFFTFRGKKSYELELLGKPVLELMRERLNAEVCAEDELPEGDKAVFFPVYPLLTRAAFTELLKERAGSFAFAGGYVDRGGKMRLGSQKLDGGLFSHSDLAALKERAMRESALRCCKKGAWVEAGAEVDFTAEIGAGAIVRRGARIKGNSVIGENAEIGAGSEITDSRVGANTVIRASFLDGVQVGKNCTVGPCALLRGGSKVGDGCRVGDFVELKNAVLGDGCKAAHLAYVGDAELGERVNVGCGTVFANYNGTTKSKTFVGNGCFLGSNSNLIAPLRLGDGVYIAAGTTVTQNLETDDFCIGRCRETVKPQRAKKYLDKKK